MKRSLPMYQDFFVQHPFLFALICNKTGSMYFAGRINHLDECIDVDPEHDEL